MKLTFTLTLLIAITASFVGNKSMRLFTKESPKDSVFVFRNSRNLDFLDTMTMDHFVEGHFQELTNKEKEKYLSFLFQNSDGARISKTFLKNDIQAFIVSKQQGIGCFEPTIVKLFGTDYTGLVILNLTTKGKLVSFYPIFSFENSGPEIYEDTLIVTRPIYRCNFSDQSLIIEKSFGTVYIDTILPLEISFIHTNRYKVSIDETGMFTTETLDSLSYEQPFELSDFNSF